MESNYTATILQQFITIVIHTQKRRMNNFPHVYVVRV